MVLSPIKIFFIRKERCIWDVGRGPVKMEAEIQCDVSENQGKLGIAASQQKTGKKPFSFSIPSCQQHSPFIPGREGDRDRETAQWDTEVVHGAINTILSQSNRHKEQEEQ